MGAEGIDYDKLAEEELRDLQPYDDKLEAKSWTWPTEGKFANYYKHWMLIHCAYYQFFVVSRISFERNPEVWVVYLDFYMNLVYLFDMVRCMTEPFVKDGRMVTNRKQIIIHYLKGWFIWDVYCFFPLSYFCYTSVWELGGKNDIQNLLDLNFKRLPRFYRIMLMMMMVRARGTMRFFQNLLKNLDFKIEVQNLIQTFVILVYILHVAGCFWNAASEGDIYHYTNWIRKNELSDSGLLKQYVASLYWATVTCTTVGYGDILPTNKYELFWAMCIIVFGVAIFSYILSDLSSKFSEITRSNASNQERIQQID